MIVPTFSRSELEAARNQAFEEGRVVAAGEAAVADHAAIRQSLAAVAAQLGAARNLLAHEAEQTALAIAQVLMQSLGAILPQLVSHYGEAELQALVAAILPGLFKEPTVIVRLHPQHCVTIARLVEDYDPDLATRLQIVPSTTMPLGDISVAWRNGGAARDVASLWSGVADALRLAGLAPVTMNQNRELEHAR